MDTEKLIIFGVIQFFAAILSGAAGGGFIIAPLMIALGLSPASAIATAKFGGLGLAIGTSTKFYGEKITSKRTLIIFALLGIFTAVLGSILLLHFKDEGELLQKIVGFMILFVGIPMIYLKNLGLERKNRSRPVKAVGTVLLGLSNIFQTALSTGISMIQMTILMTFFGMTALNANATRRVIQLVSAIVSLAIFISAAIVDYKFGIVSFIMALAGGYAGAHLAVKKGNKFVINMMALTSGLLAIYLLIS